jgi:hypothetical protein
MKIIMQQHHLLNETIKDCQRMQNNLLTKEPRRLHLHHPHATILKEIRNLLRNNL